MSGNDGSDDGSSAKLIIADGDDDEWIIGAEEGSGLGSDVESIVASGEIMSVGRITEEERDASIHSGMDPTVAFSASSIQAG